MVVNIVLSVDKKRSRYQSALGATSPNVTISLTMQCGKLKSWSEANVRKDQ